MFAQRLERRLPWRESESLRWHSCLWRMMPVAQLMRPNAAPSPTQVQGTGDCLFHSIAIGMAFEDEGAHLDMYDPSLGKRVEKLRQQAVDTLVEDPKRVLHIEADQTISTDELVA